MRLRVEDWRHVLGWKSIFQKNRLIDEKCDIATKKSTRLLAQLRQHDGIKPR